ncbi:MAG: DUF6051 family protein [Bacteroidota bacterium]
MSYQEDYKKLAKLYHPDKDIISDDEIEIVNTSFHSRFLDKVKIDNISESLRDVIIHDKVIDENLNFIYPVILNKQQAPDSEVIILFHGLNERFWQKYLPWGKSLCIKTGYPVILFPLSFHMNRSPKEWSNPRRMMPRVKKRKQKYSTIRESSVANVAISDRLDEYPQRFMLSGLETYVDVMDLVDTLYQGKHPVLKGINTVHFFGYSIGALLAQVLLMADDQKRFSQSKAFLFCGGTTLDKMQGTSRFIIDSAAFEAIKQCYVAEGFCLSPEDFPIETTDNAVITAFSYMMNSAAFPDFRKSAIKAFQNRLQACALIKDDVIPAEAIKETFTEALQDVNGVVTSLDFPYPYSHVTPFPCDKYHTEVNNAFEKVFIRAAEFLR